jgi:hypothetical protein
VSPKPRGRFLGVPYDFRRSTWKRIRRNMWNPHDRRVFVDRAYGWGYDVNFAALWRRVSRRGRR